MGPGVKQLVLDGQSLITPEAIAAELGEADARLHGESLVTAGAKLALILGMAKENFDRQHDPAAIIDRTAADLHALRRDLHHSIWQLLIPIAQNHPVADFFLQDPFTRWSYEKPRGYSGDAHLLDFIYGHPNVEEDIAAASDLGRALYAYTRQASSSVAVRERRDLLTRHVDEVASACGGGAEILTIAAGHLREAAGSAALREGGIGRWIALDQDPQSVGSIIRDYAGTPVEAIDGSVRGLLTNAYKLGRFDLAYAAGLYDYLPFGVAVKLTKKCMEMLKPGGTFIFANFAENIGVDGYMETFMNWALLLRSEADMWKIINASVDRNMVDAHIYFGENRNVVYGVVQKHA